MDINAIRLQNLRLLAHEAGGRPKLSEKMDMNYQLLSQYIGKTPTKNIGDQTARAAETAMGKPFGWLDIWREPAEFTAPPTPPKTPASLHLPEKIAFGPDYVDGQEIEVPQLKLVLSQESGIAHWVADTDGNGNRYKLRWSHKHGFDPEKLTTMQVCGDSMMPTLLHGGTVILDTADVQPRLRRIYAILYQRDFYINRLFIEADGNLRVISDNPDKVRYPDWLIPPQYRHTIQVLGRAVQIQNDL